MSQKKKIVAIGGGTGSMAVLSGLKRYPDLDLSVIVSMTDDGGSNAVIRDEFGLLPLSDMRKSIIALADMNRKGNELLRKIFTYRFSRGEGLSGHTLGNLIMMGLVDITGSETGSAKAASDLFRLKGKVVPVTLQHANLVAEYDDGTQVSGQHLIDEPPAESERRIAKLFMDPKAQANPEALDVIMNADYIVAGPGDLHTTTLANIIVGGIANAIQHSPAKFIFISNLMTKRGQTHWMKASDLINEIKKYCNREPDIVLVHEGNFTEEILERYRKEGEHAIEDNLNDGEHAVIRKNFVSGITEKDKGDNLKRSLIRHDPEKLGAVLCEIVSPNNAVNAIINSSSVELKNG